MDQVTADNTPSKVNNEFDVISEEIEGYDVPDQKLNMTSNFGYPSEFDEYALTPEKKMFDGSHLEKWH